MMMDQQHVHPLFKSYPRRSQSPRPLAISFLPKLNLPHAIIRDSSKPSVYSPLHLEVDRKQQIVKKQRGRHLRNRSHFLSSRVDFFDDKNNRRLEIHKKRIIEDIMPSVFKKSPVYMPEGIKKNSSARLVGLIERIYIPELESNEGQFVALTNHYIDIDEADRGGGLLSHKKLKH